MAAQSDNTFDGYTIELENSIDLYGHYWKPLYYFKGTFEGNNHTISNLRMGTADTPCSDKYAGLFKRTFDAGIRDVDIDITLYIDYMESFTGEWQYGTSYIGGIVGDASSSAITNCSISGTISTEHTTYAGGIVGYGESLTISGCSVTGSLTGGVEVASAGDGISFTGLIAGCSSGTISDCSASGSVTCGDNAYVGGITGSGVDASNCSFTGSVTCGAESFAGGLIGWGGNTEGCRASADVTGSGECRIGGLIGYAEGTVKNCYATGSVAGGYISNVGGLIGSGENCTVESCFSSAGVRSSDSSSAAGFIGHCSDGSIENCYATGSVTGGTACNIDGFSGLLYRVSLTNCYAAGSVTGSGNSDIGVFSLISSLSGCFWNTDAALTVDGTAQSNGTSAAGLTTAEMTRENAEANMTGFDFTSADPVWVTATNSGSAGYYPQLAVFAESTDPAVAAASLESVKTDAYYKLTFDLNGGSQTDETALEQWIVYGGTGTVPVFEKTGFLFNFWISITEEWVSFDVGIDEVSEDITYFIEWNPDTGYNINGITLYDPDSAEIESIPASPFTAQVSVDIPGAPDSYYYVILAAYDADGRLTDIRCTRASTDNGSVLSFSFDLDGEIKNISSIKAMLLDNLGTPLAGAVAFA
ncbi:MAG: GLUG motif-containing protein [Oscillospiraceae bacterium]